MSVQARQQPVRGLCPWGQRSLGVYGPAVQRSRAPVGPDVGASLAAPPNVQGGSEANLSLSKVGPLVSTGGFDHTSLLQLGVNGPPLWLEHRVPGRREPAASASVPGQGLRHRWPPVGTDDTSFGMVGGLKPNGLWGHFNLVDKRAGWPKLRGSGYTLSGPVTGNIQLHAPKGCETGTSTGAGEGGPKR
jgi:hypothetical protein